jgi:photosystem II stability/assembly factor-like uncharacterized protein
MFQTKKPVSCQGAFAMQVFVVLTILFSESPFARSQCPGVARWKQIGPGPIIITDNPEGPDSGMVRDLAIDPRGSSDQTIYIATDNGGIWKTTDGGTTWYPKTELMPSLNMGAVALDPGNPSIVYAGTGNEYNANFFKGAGIYKSLDGGDSWTILGGNLFTNVAINRIVLPAPNVLLIATGNGIYRSIDGGANFGNNTFCNNNAPIRTGDVTDLDVDTSLSTTAYASIAGSGIFKSVDSGATFPTNMFSASNGGANNIYYLAFAQSTQPNNQTMYVNAQLTSGGAQEGMFKSTDGGRNWIRVTLTGDTPNCQCGYDQTIGVDPQDAMRVYFGTRALFMSTDGGASGLGDASRIDYPKIHSDQHALVFSPPSHRTNSPPAPTRFYNGTDGGLATNPDGGVNNWVVLNGSINCSGPGAAPATVLLRQIDIGRNSTLNNFYTFGASQDNGVSAHRPVCAGTPWVSTYIAGSDGLLVAVDPRDARHVLAASNVHFLKSDDGGNSWADPGPSGFVSGTSITFLYFDPNGGIAYGAQGDGLYQSTNNGAGFSLIKTFAPSGNSLTAINMVDSNTIWIGRSNGTVWHTSDANQGASAHWAVHLIPGAPNQPIVGIAIDPTDVTQVIVVYPGTGNGSTATPGQAFRTTDNGINWPEITGNLPGLPLHAVVIDPNTSPHSVVVATEAGVMRTLNFGVTWSPLGAGLPSVQCTSLAMDSSATPSLLRVGTYGRSAFELAYDRKYVNFLNSTFCQDGTRECPFKTVTQAVNSAPSGDVEFINIQGGNGFLYQDSPLTIRTCCTLRAIGGPVTIQ